MFGEGFSPMEDWELFLRIARHFEFRFVDEPLVVQYHQPDSISANRSALIKAFKLILETYFEDIQQDKRVLANYYFRLGNYLCRHGELGQGRGNLIKSIKAYPLDTRALGALVLSLFGQGSYNAVAKVQR
jgi:hypothetical protein